ncbi:uncharacterized protein LOC108242277 isoform X2 [Kryptolebias marmoratus]|uniref:uncharacterized protein LOC108242277 isoform X2 n=1 Tax=Kryptolebias marmoratus TaxID=37003 RepID=UPI000D53068C|nr:uncharacterized protein LOC108242277 isoform X2 [Kryptolebias marmoratus]
MKNCHVMTENVCRLQTFTGAYVYCLLPVFSSSTLQSVLASIGYLPHNDASQSEFRLSADADPKTAMQLGFELLLARVLCYNVLDLLLEDQLGPQEWLEALQRREQPAKETDHTEKKTVLDDMKDNEEKKDKEEVSVDLESGPASKPQPKPRCYHLSSVDQSVMEMQRIYPDLAFRGRPLMTEQLHRAHGATGSKKVPHQAAVSKRDSIRGSQAGAPTLLSRDDFSKVDKSAGISERTSGSAEENDGRSTTTSDASATDENRVDDGLSGPQAISLYITLRAGSKVKPRLKPEKPPSIEEDPAETQHPGGENVRVARQEFQSSSSGDEEQELRELSERMGHLHVREDKAEAKRTKREEGARGERRQKERGAVKPNLKTQEMEMNEVVGHDPGRYAKSSQPDWMLGSEQSQPSVLTESSADCLSCRGVQEGKGSGRDPKGQAEEKQVTLC